MDDRAVGGRPRDARTGSGRPEPRRRPASGRGTWSDPRQRHRVVPVTVVHEVLTEHGFATNRDGAASRVMDGVLLQTVSVGVFRETRISTPGINVSVSVYNLAGAEPGTPRSPRVGWVVVERGPRGPERVARQPGEHLGGARRQGLATGYVSCDPEGRRRALARPPGARCLAGRPQAGRRRGRPGSG
jgi:hypothetical protein